MRRKVILVSIIVGLVVALLVVAILMVKHEPEFFRSKSVPAGAQRTTWSKEFQGELFTKLFGGITSQQELWKAEFTEQQVNSYFSEGFIESGVANTILPDGVSDLRVSFAGDRIRLGFRYGSSPWDTTMTMDFRIWLAQKEPNVVAIQLLGVHAGAIPVSAKSLLKQIGDMAQKERIDVNWYRYEGHPVAVLRFQSSKPRATWQLQNVQVQKSKLIIAGKTRDPSQEVAKIPNKKLEGAEPAEEHPRTTAVSKSKNGPDTRIPIPVPFLPEQSIRGN